MARALRPGPASLQGLRWLARVGPAPLEAWRCAMGWSEVAARSHARRLEHERWLARYPMTRGDGSLFVATPNGNRVLAVSLRAAGVPAPTWWAHHCGSAWMAAWLGLRGHRFLGDRELLEDRAWAGEISWHDRKGYHEAHHRPDLVGIHEHGWETSIEVELAQKSIERLRAILGMHARWRAYRRTGGVIYVCRDQDGCERVRRVAEKSGSFPAGSIGLRIELLDTIKREAIEMCEQRRSARRLRSAGALQAAGDRTD